MNKRKLVGLVALVLAGGTTSLWLQQRAIQRLHVENARLRDAAALNEARETTRADFGQNNSELERLRLEHDELLRLRAEIAKARKQVAEVTAKGASSPATRPAAQEPERPLEPVQTFVANAEAVVPADHGLIFGGWPTSPGKCTLIFVQPKIFDLSSPGHVGSVFLETQFVEVPDEGLAALGLTQLKAATRATSTHSIFPNDEMKTILAAFKGMTGADILAAPRVQTGDGRQAVVSVTEQKTIAGEEHTLGPSLDIEPKIAADGSSVTVTLSARMKRATVNN